MAAAIDPRLQAELDRAGDDGQVEALLALSSPCPSAQRDAAPEDPGQRLVARVARRLDQSAAATRYLPKLGVLYVRGSGRLVRALLEDESVVAASSNDYTVGSVEG
jgi:hypothetical protein